MSEDKRASTIYMLKFFCICYEIFAAFTKWRNSSKIARSIYVRWYRWRKFIPLLWYWCRKSYAIDTKGRQSFPKFCYKIRLRNIDVKFRYPCFEVKQYDPERRIHCIIFLSGYFPLKLADQIGIHQHVYPGFSKPRVFLADYFCIPPT